MVGCSHAILLRGVYINALEVCSTYPRHIFLRAFGLKNVCATLKGCNRCSRTRLRKMCELVAGVSF